MPQGQAYALPRHESAHINSAEIDAIVIALKLWLPTLAGGFVIIHTDNTTAEAAFGSGTTRSTESMNLLRDAAVLAAAADIKLLRMPGVLSGQQPRRRALPARLDTPS